MTAQGSHSTTDPRPAGGARSFFRQYLADPGAIGAIAPSSAHLARRMLEGLDLARAGVVVEFGPGTGAFTGEIASRVGPMARFIAIERNPDLARLAAERFSADPRVRIVSDDAAHVADICRREGLGEPPCVDAVISGLPWAGFPPALQDRLLKALLGVLKPGGVFVTFAYQFGHWLPAGRRFAAKARSLFKTVEKSPVVWRNLPPAFVYRCTTASHS